jgi:hypothetical protein
MDDALQALVDRQAIHDCLLRYARGVDRLDEELLRSAFHDDVSGIVDYVFAQEPKRTATAHYILNHLIELDGDVAHSEAYFLCVIGLRPGEDPGYMATGADAQSSPMTFLGGRYVNRFERRDGEWRLVVRESVGDWHAIADGSQLNAYLAAMPTTGVRNRSDVSYERPLRPRA